MKLSEITVAILAGGLGTRLQSAVPDRPKALALIHGQPFLSYLLRQIELAGLRNAVLCTGVGAAQIQETFGESFGELRLAYSREETPLGTAGALRQALPQLASDWFLTFNGDSFVESQLHIFAQWHEEKKARASILLAQRPDTSRFGRVERNEQDEITRFAEKAASAGAGWINAGVYLLPKTTIATIPDGRAVSLEREIFPGLIGRGLCGFPGGGRFLDIGTPESYAAAEEFFER